MSKPVRKYSKSSAFYLATKKDFFQSNERLLETSRQQNQLYTSGPERLSCKICQHALPDMPDFHQHGVDYVFCKNCDHLNGVFDDDESFVDALYMKSEGKDYSKNYIDTAYDDRTQTIYRPKVEFLCEHLPKDLTSLLDVGCGAGYFVNAAIHQGLDAQGIDVSESMTSFGNRQIQASQNKQPLMHVGESALFDAIQQTDREIVSAIGVIEHLRQPALFFEAIRHSSVKYVYYSVPMYSVSVLLEHAFPTVFPRQLSGGHTHLFTEKSLQTMNALMNASPIAEWRFGTDMMDLFRSLSVMAGQSQTSDTFQERLVDEMTQLVDPLQSVLDENHFCSEIHVLVSCATSPNA